jgi:hypothetical protein
MSRYNFYILLLIIFSCNACKSPYYNFSGETDTKIFFKNIPKILSGIQTIQGESRKLKDLDSMKIFMATFNEFPVERDAIPEWKLINKDSKKQMAEMVDDFSIGHSNFLHLYFLNLDSKERLCIYFAAGNDENNKYNRLGPAYLGLLRSGQINMLRELTVVNTKSGYVLDEIKRKPVNMFWYINVDSINDNIKQLLITRIDYKMPNKISGKKATIYNIERIFNDSSALTFIRVN